MGLSPPIERIELRPGYRIPRLVHGGWQLSRGHRLAGDDIENPVDALGRVVEAGYTTFDGADIYTGVESLYGELLRRQRARGTETIRVHTKLVPDRADLARVDREYVKRIVDRSRRRLGVDTLDLVQFHWWDWSVPGWLEAFGFLDDLRRAGKIRHLGVTNFDVEHLRRLLDAGFDVVAHQLQYSLLDRRPERGMVDLCREHGVHLLAYGSLAGGFLTERWLGRDAPDGAFETRSQVKYRLIVEEFGGWDAFQELLAALDGVARRRGVSIADVAMRWALDRPAVAAIVVGGRGDEHARANRRALFLRLDDEDRAEIDAVLARHPGPPGDVFGLEREPGGRHAVIMKTNLNRAGS